MAPGMTGTFHIQARIKSTGTYKFVGGDLFTTRL